MSLIIQVLIISVVVVVAQSASLSPYCKSSDVLAKAKNRSKLQSLIVHLYCVAISLHGTVNRNRTAVPDVQLPNNSTQDTKFNEVFSYFSDECKNFTEALLLKHYLQEYLFNETNNSTDSRQIGPLYSILVYLETVANILDDIQFNNNHSVRCVRLTANRYKMMYHVLQQRDASLLNKAEHWIDDKYYKENLKDGKPSICTCKTLYPTLDSLI